jgi:hypothetical protein
MESDGGGAPTFFAGQSVCGVPPNNPQEHCKVIAYPPTHTIKGSYSAKTGVIRLVVPMKFIAGGDHPLFSITGVTATQTQPGSSGAATLNVIDSTAPYDLR